MWMNSVIHIIIVIIVVVVIVLFGLVLVLYCSAGQSLITCLDR
jgi:hypothetical protein